MQFVIKARKAMFFVGFKNAVKEWVTIMIDMKGALQSGYGVLLHR